jgi:hypothetical protein
MRRTAVSANAPRRPRSGPDVAETRTQRTPPHPTDGLLSDIHMQARRFVSRLPRGARELAPHDFTRPATRPLATRARPAADGAAGHAVPGAQARKRAEQGAPSHEAIEGIRTVWPRRGGAVPLGACWFTDHLVASSQADHIPRAASAGGPHNEVASLWASPRATVRMNQWTQPPLLNSTKGASKFCNAVRFGADRS